MRIAFIFFFLTFSSLLLGQNNFAKQLRQVINDTTNHFEKFKGSIRETSDTESIYYNSLITLEGTSDNLVSIHRLICSYSADIADSVTKNKGKKILDEWKIKLMSILGSGYKIEKGISGFSKSFIDGWRFYKGNFAISISLYQHFYDKSLYVVTLFIANEHPRPPNL